MKTVFFSYSHRDEEMRDELETHLAMMKRQGLIDAVHDRRITAGEPLDSAVNAYVNEADVILCLLSPDFIASEYCFSKEMERALERHRREEAVVIPVILRHCDWKNTPLRELRGTPRDNRPVRAWSDRDEAFLQITEDVRSALEKLGAVPKAVRAPETKSSESAFTSPEIAAASETRPRSSNLQVTREPTDLDKRRFLRTSFDYCAEMIANSGEELRRRSPDIDIEFNRVDANRFTCTLYKGGMKVGGLTVYIGSMGRGDNDISYHLSDDGRTNTANGTFNIVSAPAGLGFATIFGGGFGRQNQSSSAEEIAEQIWGAFIEPLQRRR